MPSPGYRPCRDAIIGREEITCYYQGLYREPMPRTPPPRHL
jgi:hypothetical protein